MLQNALLAQISADPRLPAPPAITFQILDKVNSAQCTITEIARLIAQDPPLCGKILKIVNSSLFGIPRAVTSIQSGVSLLGLKRVRSLVLSLALPAMQQNTAAGLRQDFWRLSVSTGIVARDLALRLGWPDPDTEMVCGLLCDLGVLVLNELNGRAYAEIMQRSGLSLMVRQCSLEHESLGVTHAEVSAHILKAWRLPEEMTEPIRRHHEPQHAAPPYRDRAELLHFAHRVAQLEFTVDSPTIVGDITKAARERYGMDDRTFQKFLDPLSEKSRELAGLLQVDIGACESFATLLGRATESLSRLALETSLENVRAEERTERAERELKKTEEALESAEEKLRQAVKMEAIGRLAGGVAHDFNNLLTVINGCSELLLSMMTAGDAHRVLVEEIKKAGDRAGDLTRQLLAFSRKQFLVPKPLHLNDVVTGIEKMLRRLIDENIALELALEKELRVTLVDPSQMDQVILNLVLNARDAMPQGGTLRIETRNVDLDAAAAPRAGLQPGAYVLLAISDTGCGMAAEVRAKIFEPFFTTKPEGHGTGLGLATVHGIVIQSGGQINVQSDVGRGTTFQIYLPVAGAAATAPSPSAPASGRGRETVLLAEDDDAVRRMVRQMLESYGYRVFEAADGLEALEVATRQPAPIDVLVADIVMPNMGGAELARALTAQRADLQVLYISGYTDDAAVRFGVQQAEAAYLQKPFTPQALALKVRETLERRRPAKLDGATLSPV
ncbi:MAG: HDOD domain-containing protein [Gemmataceae bacterium]